MSDTVIVIPCFNEARRLDVKSFKSYVSAAHQVRLLFVDDGSSDDTPAIIRTMHEENPAAFDTYSMPRNSGKAEAVRAGMLKAVESRPMFIGFWDADLSTKLDEIAPFRQIMLDRPEIHMVFGARVNLLGRKVRRKLSRHYIGRLFATMMAFALGLGVYDTQCGAKLFRATDEMQRVFADRFISKWIFDVEIIARYIRARAGTDLPKVETMICEKPLLEWTDVAGSKLRPRDFFRVVADLWRIYRRYLRHIR